MPYYYRDPKRDHNFDNHPYALELGFRRLRVRILSEEFRHHAAWGGVRSVRGPSSHKHGLGLAVEGLRFRVQEKIPVNTVSLPL